MNEKQDFGRLYSDVSTSIDSALADIEGLEVEHEDGRKLLESMLVKLRQIRMRFDDELSLLEKHSEWEKFTIAFFGETNAGKSTILESLRILFDEESRQALLKQNADDLESQERVLSQRLKAVRSGLQNVYSEYASEIAGIRQSSAELAAIVGLEADARVRRRLWLFAGTSALAGALLGGSAVALIGA